MRLWRTEVSARDTASGCTAARQASKLERRQLTLTCCGGRSLNVPPTGVACPSERNVTSVSVSARAAAK